MTCCRWGASRWRSSAGDVGTWRDAVEKNRLWDALPSCNIKSCSHPISNLNKVYFLTDQCRIMEIRVLLSQSCFSPVKINECVMDMSILTQHSHLDIADWRKSYHSLQTRKAKLLWMLLFCKHRDMYHLIMTLTCDTTGHPK